MDAERETWYRRVVESAERARNQSLYQSRLMSRVIIFNHHQLMQNLLWEDPVEPRRHGGSRLGRLKHKRRRAEDADERLFDDYFNPLEPVFSDKDFRRRFRMSKQLFIKLIDEVSAYDSYFIQKRDAAGKLGLSAVQKCTAAVQILGYGITPDFMDQYVRMGESTAREALKRFVKAIRGLYEARYLRKPTREDILQQMQINESRGWPGMFASLDCMHYEWKNCPVAWQGHYQNKDHDRSIVLEAVADQSLWIWHAFFGVPGSNNDLTVLDRSPLVQDYLRGESQNVSFVVNGHTYNGYYLLVDGIYPKWKIFVQSISQPLNEKLKWYAKKQEGARKDSERCFGVLQQRWGIIRQPNMFWHEKTVHDIMYACIILHNMIIEDKRNHNLPGVDIPEEPIVPGQSNQGSDEAQEPNIRHGLLFDDYRRGIIDIQDMRIHFDLKRDLIEHWWARRGNRIGE